MSTLDIARSWTATSTDHVVMPRRHVVAIAILMCVPLPLFSLAATVVPLPQLVQRAAMPFVSLAAPAFGHDGSLIRAQANPVRSVKITYRPSEQALSQTEVTPARVRSTPTRGIAARGGYAKALAHNASGRTGVAPAKPNGGADDKTKETTPPGSGEDPGSVDPPTGGGSPTGDHPTPDKSPDPPSSSPPAPGQAGGGGGSGSAGGGSSSGGGGSGGGARSGGGGSDGTSKEPPSPAGTPPEQGGTPPGGANGDPAPPDTGTGTGTGTSTGTGTGSGSPPESPPGQGAGSGNGNGKP